MADITMSEILNILKKVKVPNLNTDHLTLNSIKNYLLKEDTLTFDLSIPTADEKIEKEVYEKLVDDIKAEYPSLKEIHLNIGTAKPQISTHKDPKKEAMLPGVKNKTEIHRSMFLYLSTSFNAVFHKPFLTVSALNTNLLFY